jgi:hypothetical protein
VTEMLQDMSLPNEIERNRRLNNSTRVPYIYSSHLFLQRHENVMIEVD